MRTKLQAKNGEFWWIQVGVYKPDVAAIAGDKAFPCGDEQGWPLADIKLLRRIPKMRLRSTRRKRR